MNILQIANKAIYPPDGGSLAILSLTKGFIKCGRRVHLLNMVTHKHVNNEDIIDDCIKDSLKITGVNVDTKFSFLRVIINFLFSQKPLISQRFVSQEFRNKLTGLIKNNTFDFIQIEGLYTLQYISSIRINYKGNILYRPHNIEYQIWERNYQESSSFLKRIYFKSLYKRLKKLEKRFLNSYDFLIPISQQDADKFNKLGNIKPCIVSPFGIDLKKFNIRMIKEQNNKNQSINYIGALDWIPNQKGLLWFVDECFSEILKEFPNIKLNIAGRNAPQWLIKKLEHKNIKFIGEVVNAYGFIQNPGPIIVPLFSGSGMRVKIIESMALKKTIIATTIAAEGINCSHKINILLANNKVEFINSTLSVLNNLNKQKEIGENAYKFVEKNYGFEKIASNILNFIK